MNKAMTKSEILSHVDHTLLSPTATWEDIRKTCDEAVEFGVASVCIPPAFVKRAAKYVGNRIPICTVVGFPLGYSAPQIKVAEAALAVAQGASEVDMVASLACVKSGDLAAFASEVRAVKEACGKKTLKVIIETCLLTDEEKVRACRSIFEAGADFVKTSTGFSSGGATEHDVALLVESAPAGLSVKASGGISDFAFAQRLLELGASRLGTSKLVKLASAERNKA